MGSAFDDESDSDADLHHWFGSVERIIRKPLWRDLIPGTGLDNPALPADKERPCYRLLGEVASLREQTSFRSQPTYLQRKLLHDFGTMGAVSILIGTSRSIIRSSQELRSGQAKITIQNHYPAGEKHDMKRLYEKRLPLVVRHREWSAAIHHKKKRRSASSAAQPTSVSTTAPLVSAIPSEALLVILGFVGAHNLEAIWECSACSPHWYDWYCTTCQLRSKYLAWSNRAHFGYCKLADSLDNFLYSANNFCGCCRSIKDGYGCDSCDDLWYLKVTCHTMRDCLKRYSGT